MRAIIAQDYSTGKETSCKYGLCNCRSTELEEEKKLQIKTFNCAGIEDWKRGNSFKYGLCNCEGAQDWKRERSFKYNYVTVQEHRVERGKIVSSMDYGTV